MFVGWKNSFHFVCREGGWGEGEEVEGKGEHINFLRENFLMKMKIEKSRLQYIHVYVFFVYLTS